MKTKICKRILVIICILAITLPISSEVLARIANSSRGSTQTFGISLMHASKKLNGELNIGFGYRVDTKNAYRIYSGSDNEDGYADTVLCLDRNGKFPKEEDSTNRGDYTSLGTATEQTLNQAKSSIDSQDAHQIQWLIQNALIPEDSSDLRDQKLAKIFGDLMKSTETNANPVTLKGIKEILTEDDIVFALQCSLWEITNNISGYAILGTSDNGGTWDQLVGNDKWGYKGLKGTYIYQIINYYRAHFNDNITEGTTGKTDPTFDNSKTAQVVTSGAYAFIGPFRINPATNYYSVDISFQNISGAVQNNVSYALTDKPSNQNVKILAQTKDDLEGKDFYIRLRTTTSARKVKIRLATQVTTKSATGTVWKDDNVIDQPLLSIKREEEPGRDIEKDFEFQITLTKEYDASLRKYITTIRRKTTTPLGHEATEIINLADKGMTRVPKDILKAATGQEPFNQYVYNHRKDPVKVQVNDLVVYTIRITNECRNTLIIKSITDYLPPSGIEYVTTDSIYNSEDNKWSYSSGSRSATTTKSDGWTLDPGGHKDIQIVCKVTEEAKGKVVTNIAEITKMTDEHGNEVEDIDSEPGNIKLPKTDKEWQEYQGNTGTTPDGTSEPRYENKKDLTDSDYYYKGQQDDDDFEKLIVDIPMKEYDLEIIKVDQETGAPLPNAQFEVSLPDGSTQILKTTSNGKAKTRKIGISEQGTDNVKIVEKVAPTGYDKLEGGIDLWVDKVVVNGDYKIGEARLTTIIQNMNASNIALNGTTITITIPNEKKVEQTDYEVEIVKVDKDDNTKKLAGAKFDVTLPDGTTKEHTTGVNGTISTGTLSVTQEGTDIIKITEKEAPNGYKKIIDTVEIEVTKQLENNKYIAKTVAVKNNTPGASVTINGNKIIITVQDEKEPGKYDLQIVKVDKDEPTKKLAGAKFKVTLPDGTTKEIVTQADGTVKTDAIPITQTGTDTIKIEEITAPSGYTKIIDALQIDVTKEVENNQYVAKKAILKNNPQYASISSDGDTIIITVQDEKELGNYNLQIVKIDKEDNNKKLSGAEFEVTLPDGTKRTVTTGADGVTKIEGIGIRKVGKETIKITETKAPRGYSKIIENIEVETTVELKDGEHKVTSVALKNTPSGAKVGLENDTIIATVENKLGVYDLALKKFITSVTSANGTNKVLPESQKRKLEVTNVDRLVNRTGDEKADATYKLNKTPVDVANGDYVTYTIRVFNEGNLNAVVKEIVDTVPEGLEFVPYETNSDGTYKSGSRTNYTYKWEVFKDKKTETGWTEGVRTRYLADKLALPGFDKTKASGENKELGLSYTEVKIEFKVNLSNISESAKENILKNGIKNIAEITDDDGDDNDSTPDDKDPEEDDEDYDIVIPKEFDLALRKFITKINETDVTDRVPKVTYADGKIKYEHTKEPKIVVEGQTVIYTIRVYNEGTLDGYATEITDDLPKGITFLPKHETNIEYEWKMYDQAGNETDDVSKAVKIKTRYLSREKSVNNLLTAFDSTKSISDTNPAHKEVKVAFEVTQDSVTAGNKVIINTAQISEDEDKDGNPIEDRDSVPGNDKEDEDDIDKEYLVLKYFDLALLKYVSKVIVTEDGVTKETETGYNGEENPEPVVKVELDRKKLDKTDIKYVYSIKIMNQGEIEGYATEITDRIPDGLEFYEEDNTQFNWKKTSDGTATTDYLKNTLLKPGESTIIQIVLRWRRDESNLGQKVNIAEITADDNEYDVPDIDSTPNNNKEGEDDQDNAIVVLSIKTGAKPTYIAFIIGITTLIAIGAYQIYKSVIKR